jgi:methionyl-tRNA synthetase
MYAMKKKIPQKSDKTEKITEKSILGEPIANKKILITSALVYANGPLHIGHLVEYIQTDIYVRFLKLIGNDVIYCCADDTHGAPISINAEKNGVTPEEFIAKFYQEHIFDFNSFMIDFDSYYTTNSMENKHFSDTMFEKCKKNGFIYKKKVMQLYCPKCNRFLPDRYVKGTCPKCRAENQYGDVCEKCGASYKATELLDPFCSLCKSEPTQKESKHYFFKLSAFSGKLDHWLETNKNLQKEIVNSVRQWVKEGLNDWDISRDGPYFGFKIPEEDNLYYYVWFDAPIGYIASTENYCKNITKIGNAEDLYWKNKDSKIIHVIGKDIIYFHFLFWPAVLMASEFRVPDNIIVHGFLTVNGEKMSKSRGTFLTAKDFAEKYEPEYLRYYYANMLSKKMSDIDLNFKDFEDRVNNELVANLGNFCFRTMTFVKKNFPEGFSEIDENKAIIDEINQKIQNIEDAYREVNLKEAAKETMALSAIGNKYFQDNEPWKLMKTDLKKAEKVLGLCVNIVKNLSILMAPIMPLFSEELERQLGFEHLKWKDLNFDIKKHHIANAGILIMKIEKDKDKETCSKKNTEKTKANIPKANVSGKKHEGIVDAGSEKKHHGLKRPVDHHEDDGKTIIAENMMPFNLRVGEVIEVEAHPDAEKLFVIQVDLGDEKRQLVAGLKQYMKMEELIGKKIVVVANLEHAKLRGVISEGMLLAADKDGIVKVIEPKKSKPGDKVYITGFNDSEKMINYKEFSRSLREVKSKKILINGHELKTDSEVLHIDMPDGAEVR